MRAGARTAAQVRPPSPDDRGVPVASIVAPRGDGARRAEQAPIVPTAQHPGDTSNFENYPEPSDEDGKPTGHDPYRHLFLSF